MALEDLQATQPVTRAGALPSDQLLMLLEAYRRQIDAAQTTLASQATTIATNTSDLDAVEAEIAAARGSRAALADRLAVISNFASPNAGGIVSGAYYDAALHATTAPTLAGATNRVEMAPFYTSMPMAIDLIGALCSTGVASAQGKVFIYSAGSDNWPDELLFESGALDFATTGYKSEALSFTFNGGTQYWLGVRHSSTATVRSIAVANTPNLGAASPTLTTYFTVIRRTLAFATALPASWGFNAAELTANVTPPLVRFRAA